MDTKKQVQEQFGKHAHQYVTSPGHAKGSDLAALLALANPVRTDRVLDIATGGGHVANAFAPYVSHVTALDLTAGMLQAAEQFITANGHRNVQFIQGDAEQLPFPAEVFTIVACRIAPHHFPHVSSFLSESSRVLQHEGQFLLVDNVAPEADDLDAFYNTIEKMRDHSHYRAWKKSEWLQMAEGAGLEVQQLITFPKVFRFETWCRMMDVQPEAQAQLTQYMLQAPANIRQYFHIVAQNHAIVQFTGQSILLVCRKR